MVETLSMLEVAKLLGVARITIKRWSQSGKLKFTRVGKRGDRRYLRSEIERLIGGTK